MTPLSRPLRSWRGSESESETKSDKEDKAMCDKAKCETKFNTVVLQGSTGIPAKPEVHKLVSDWGGWGGCLLRGVCVWGGSL